MTVCATRPFLPDVTTLIVIRTIEWNVLIAALYIRGQSIYSRETTQGNKIFWKTDLTSPRPKMFKAVQSVVVVFTLLQLGDTQLGKQGQVEQPLDSEGKL